MNIQVNIWRNLGRIFIISLTGTLFTILLAVTTGAATFDLNQQDTGGTFAKTDINRTATRSLLKTDFNNDGLADVAVLYDYGNATTGLWTFITNPNGATSTPGLGWKSANGCWDSSRSKVTAGDFNNDGLADVAVLYDYGNATTGLWTFITNPNGATATPGLGWKSANGCWDWLKTKLANSESGFVWGDPIDSIVGFSVLGRPVNLSKIGFGSRRYLFIGAHHGDEPQGGRALELFRSYLVAHPEAVPEGVEVWIIPYLNPDGVAADTRWNASGVNLNRNYWTNDWGLYDVTSMSILESQGLAPMRDMSVTVTGTPYSFNYPGPGPFSEPETIAIANLCAKTPFRAMISIHDAEGCVYWGQTGIDLAYLFGSKAGLPVVGSLSISGDATRWIGQAYGTPAITVEMTDAQADGDPTAVFNAYLTAFLTTLTY